SNKLILLSADTCEQLTGWFVGWILRDEQSADGKLQEGLFEGVDGFGAVEQQVEVGGDALPVFGQLFGGCASGECIEQRGDEPRMLLVLQPAVRFQRVAKLHQLLDTRDDAGLFGEGRKGQHSFKEIRVVDRWVCNPEHPGGDELRELCTSQIEEKELW